MARNPLATDADYEHRVRERAYHLWEADGCPHGRDLEFWERARELIGMEESAGAGLLPNPQAHPESPAQAGVEEAELQENLGEFPGQLTDQGDDRQAPMAVKRQARMATAQESKTAKLKTKDPAGVTPSAIAEASAQAQKSSPPAKRRAPAKAKKV